MENQMIFGREKVIKDIKKIISNFDGNRHLIVIQGEGGTGKTMILNLLYEYSKTLSEKDKLIKRFIVPFDYRDLYAQSGHGIHFYFMNELYKFQKENHLEIFSEKDFSEYIRAKYSLKDDVLAERLIIEKFRELEKTSIQTILFEDTLEVIENPEYIEQAFYIGAYIPNCISIIASRPGDKPNHHIKLIEEKLKSNNWLIHKFLLEPFSEDDAKDYLEFLLPDKKYSNATVKSIIELTGSKPIIMAITAEWLKREYKSSWFLEKINQENISLKNKVVNEEFNNQILNNIKDLTTPSNWIMFYMAYFNHRYDRELFKTILDVDDVYLHEIEKELESCMFMRRTIIKSNEFLHDEMQRLINDHIWDEIDKNYILRTKNTRKAIDFYYTPLIMKQKTYLKDYDCKDLHSIFSIWNIFINLASLQLERLSYLFRIKNFQEKEKFQDELKEYIQEIKSTTISLSSLTNDLLDREVISMIYQEGLRNFGLSSNVFI